MLWDVFASIFCTGLWRVSAFGWCPTGQAKPVRDTIAWNAGFTGTGNFNRTNDGTTYVFNNSIRVGAGSRLVNANLSAGWIYGKSPDRVTNNDFLAVFDADVFRNTKRWYYWALTSYESSYSLKIDNRVQTGVGPGLTVIRKPNIYLVLTDGLLYERSQLAEPDFHQRTNYETWRNSFRIKYKIKLMDKLSVDGSHFLQNSLNDGDDYIIRSSTVAGWRLKKWLNLTMALTYNNIRITNRENLLFSYGITIDQLF
ncbi:MAG: DUF481 domain-containing protein [Flavihumibacter sp.]